MLPCLVPLDYSPVGYSLVTHCRDRTYMSLLFLLLKDCDPVRSLDTLIHILPYVSLHTVLMGQSSDVSVWPPTSSTAPLSFSYAMLHSQTLSCHPIRSRGVILIVSATPMLRRVRYPQVSISTLILLIFVRGSFRPRTRLSLLAV